MASIQLPLAISYIGDTFRKRFIVKDNNVNVNLATTYTNITVWLVDAESTVLEKYSREPLAGHNTADFDQLDQTTNTGEFELNVQREISLAAAVGRYKWALKFFAEDAEFDDDKAIESFEATQENGVYFSFQELPNKTLG